MKTRTIKTLFVSAYCAALAAVVLTPAHAAQDTIPPAIERPHYYPAALAVRTCDEIPGDVWVITAETASGISYSWRMPGACDIFPGDLMAVLMDDAGTPETILDDVVIYASYAGAAAW